MARVRRPTAEELNAELASTRIRWANDNNVGQPPIARNRLADGVKGAAWAICPALESRNE